MPWALASPLKYGGDLLSVASLNVGDLLKGGFYLDQAGGSFDGLVQGASYAFYIYGDGGGTDAFLDGFGYYLASNLDPSLSFAVSTVAQSADFGGHGECCVMQLAVVPEPHVVSLLLGGLPLALWKLRRRLAIASPAFREALDRRIHADRVTRDRGDHRGARGPLLPFSSSMVNRAGYQVSE